MGEDPKNKRRGVMEDIEDLIDQLNEAVRGAVSSGSDAVESAGQSLRDTVRDTIKEGLKGVRSARDSVVMVRIDKESLGRLNELVEAGIANSRSEAAALLIAEGIKARQGLFDKIGEGIDQIRKAKDDLRHLLEDEEGRPGG